MTALSFISSSSSWLKLTFTTLTTGFLVACSAVPPEESSYIQNMKAASNNGCLFQSQYIFEEADSFTWSGKCNPLNNIAIERGTLVFFKDGQQIGRHAICVDQPGGFGDSCSSHYP